MVNNQKNQLVFNTAIITYPSDYDGLLPLALIVKQFEKLIGNNKTTKVVIAREDPDEQIQRIHYHTYFDSLKRKSITQKYFDIPLPEPVYVFIKQDTTREYKLKSLLDSELGIDTDDEMHAKMDQYIMDMSINNNTNTNTNNKIIKWDLLTVAHPNIQLKKEYGDKYLMLKYVLKQKLVARANFDVEKELEYLQENRDELVAKAEELTTAEMLKELQLNSIDELIELCKKYVKKLKNKKRKLNKNSNNKKNSNKNNNEPSEWDFTQKIRELLIGNIGITKNEVLEIIKNNEDYWHIYTSKYVNYSKLINDLFKNKPNSKPKLDFNRKFYLPKKLYEYCLWLNKWVENWMTGKTELLEHRPLGLVLIGASRTGKTSLMSLFGPFSYFKNVWNIDNWEGLPPYTIMDDMDAGDEGKGLSFCWYKPFFGAQDCMTVTDKYRPKEDIVNGKPLIWINNYDITDTFKSEVAQDYIRKNMIYVNIGNKPLFESSPDWIEGRNDYVEFDPKSTWYYQNVISKKKEEKEKENINNNDNTNNKDEDDDPEDLEPLTERKRKLDQITDFEIEKGRLVTRTRREN